MSTFKMEEPDWDMAEERGESAGGLYAGALLYELL